MPSTILVIGLVPPRDFARFLGELRARYPEAAVTALVGNPDLRSTQPQADEYLLWGDLPPRALAAELRRRRFTLFVIAFNREYYFTLTYWKVLLLTAVSRARGVLFCEQARLPKKVAPLSHLTGMPLRIAAVWVSVVCLHLARLLGIAFARLSVLLLGSLLLLLLLGLLAADAATALLRLFSRPSRNQAKTR